MEAKNKAVQTRRPRTRNRATQTEKETFPLPAPPVASRLICAVLLLVYVSLLLALITAFPGADARSLSAGEHLPSTSTGLLRAIVSLSLVIVVSKFLVTQAAAAVTTIPELPEPTTAGATAFVAAIAAGYFLVRRPRPETEEAVEVIDEAAKASEKWEPFLRDISAPEFAEWKTGLISERHS